MSFSQLSGPVVRFPCDVFLLYEGVILLSSQTGMKQYRRPSTATSTDFLHTARDCTGSLSAISDDHAAAASEPEAIATEMILAEISPRV